MAVIAFCAITYNPECSVCEKVLQALPVDYLTLDIGDVLNFYLMSEVTPVLLGLLLLVV